MGLLCLHNFYLQRLWSALTNSITLFLSLGMIEFDAIAATRGGMQDSMSSRRLLSELLLQLTEQKQLQARDAQLLRLKLASVQAPSKRPRSLKRQTENKNDSYSSGESLVSPVNNCNVTQIMTSIHLVMIQMTQIIMCHLLIYRQHRGPRE